MKIKNIFELLHRNELIKSLFEKSVIQGFENSQEIANLLIKSSKKPISSSTAQRRAETLKNWLRWMKTHQTNNKVELF